MRNPVLAATVALAISGLAVISSAQGAENDWLIRARGIHIAPDASSSALNIDVKSDTVAEIDITRFFTPNVAAELILATAAHEVTANGASLGSTKILPPVLTLQYHFLPEAQLRPYVGAGVNYTWFYDQSGGLKDLDLKNGFGWAAQAGMDYMLSQRASLNLDVKYVGLSTEVSAGGSKLADLDINPWIVGVGLGYRF